MGKSILAYKTRIAMFTVLISAGLTSAGWAASYYVDATSGSDSNPGTQTAPWQTVAKVNGFAFAPGDNVYFKAGGVWNASLYPKSGSSGKNITYGAYGTGAMPILDSCIMHSVNYATIQGLEFISVNNIPVDLQGASHNTVQNCAVYADVNNTGTWSALWVRDGSSYNQILNNTVERRNLASQGNALTVSTNTNYNVIQGNKLGIATHYALEVSGTYSDPSAVADYNIIRNNVMNNTEGAQAELIMNADYNVFDGNIMSGGKSTGYDANSACTLALNGSHNIIRNNILKDNPTSAYGLAAVAFVGNGLVGNIISNRIYNNVFTNIASRPIFLDNYNVGTSTINDNVFKNNIIADNPTGNGAQVVATAYAGTYFFGNNLIYDSGITNVLSISNTLESVSAANSGNPSSFSGNIQQAPNLDTNYHPLAGSPAINGGTYLTTVTSASGSGTVISVKDASYFASGYGMVQGDTIRIGNSTATIQSISNNTITLSTAVSWNSGDPVSLPYSASIGISAVSLSPPTNLSAL